MKKIVILFFCFSLFSCKINDVSYNYPDNPDYARKARAGKLNGDLIIYGDKKKTAENPIQE